MKKSTRIAIAQLNPTVGDYSQNFKKIKVWIRKAEKEKTDLIVFPELSLCGYPVWDLANKQGFIEEGLKVLEEIVEETKGNRVAVVVGFIEQDKKKRSYNALAWIEKGKLKAVQRKRLLPTYDVFLEDIFFRRGKSSQVIDWRKVKVGPTICEDLWDDEYLEKPVANLIKQKAKLIINISASPYFHGIEQKRDALVRRHATRHKVPILYVNQVGTQDDLIFDGRSFFVDQEGKVLFRAPAFEEGLYFFNWKPQVKAKQSLPCLSVPGDPKEMYDALVLGVRDYCRKNNFEKALLGLSGGIDSALVAAIACDALGPKKVKGIGMPSKFSSVGSWKDAESLSKNFGMSFEIKPIKKQYDFLMKEFNSKKKSSKKVTLAMENLQARLRGLQLMYRSNDEGRILLTTGNKSELAMGYCTLYGDMAGGLAVLGDVYKTEVYRLCRYRNRSREMIPENILTKPPSAELRPDQKDQDSLPPYEVLDEILYFYIEKNLSQNQIIEEMKHRNVSSKIVRETIRKTDHNEYKRRQTPPILRVTEKAWFGRRMPITNKFDS